jgi:HNH endonuclease
MAFVCIYCLRDSPDVLASEAHVFPYALGGTTSSRDTVCADCNGKVNREVEDAALSSFRWFQSMFGIAGRRGGVPGVRGTATVEGHEGAVVLGPDGLPIGPLVRVESNEEGRRSVVVYGRHDIIDPIADQIAAKHPSTTWTKSKFDVPFEVVLELPSPDDARIRRLAGKVAFERFAQLRTSTVARDSEFDGIRSFILSGVEDEPTCGLTADPRLLTSSLNIPVPAHAVVLVAHPLDRVLGSFVIFFGVLLYWVILSRRYTSLGAMDEILIEWTQNREAERPLLRQGTGSIRIPWHEFITPWVNNRDAVLRDVITIASSRLQAAIQNAAPPPPPDGPKAK